MSSIDVTNSHCQFESHCMQLYSHVAGEPPSHHFTMNSIIGNQLYHPGSVRVDLSGNPSVTGGIISNALRLDSRQQQFANFTGLASTWSSNLDITRNGHGLVQHVEAHVAQVGGQSLEERSFAAAGRVENNCWTHDGSG